MPDCNAERIGFAPLRRRAVEAAFEGGDISSDGGVLLLRKLDRRLGLLDADRVRVRHGARLRTHAVSP